MDGLRHPVERYVDKKLILGESAFYVAVTVPPVTELFEYPSRQSSRRIIQAVSQRLWSGFLNMVVRPADFIPATGVIQEGLFDLRQDCAGLQIRLIRWDGVGKN